MKGTGIVHLVGAGPGDPDLLTCKAHRLLQSADVVVYDRLVSPAILDEIPAGVSRIHVGRRSGHHALSQDEINALLVRLARGGREVVRLKGGDPFIFGRGSEEALYLRRHGIPFDVVPGVTAAAACSAYAGVPLTHRGLSRGVQLVTGHFRDDEPIDLDWQGLADTRSTLVIYMGLSSLACIRRELLDADMPAGTPAMAVQHGTTPAQRRVVGTLGDIVEQVAEAGLGAPLLVVIGETVALAGQLDWFSPDAMVAGGFLDEAITHVAQDRHHGI